MPQQGFERYFDERSASFARFYRHKRLTRLRGRGPLFDRMDFAVEAAVGVGAAHVLDVGCGSGPLFAPLVERGIRVTGIDPAPGMVRLAQLEADRLPAGMVTVRQLAWEDLDARDEYDLATALGVFDYVDAAGDLLRKMAAAAPFVVGSFPSRALRTALRKLRYRAHGVAVHGYDRPMLDDLAAEAGLAVERVMPLASGAGLAVLLSRVSALPGDGSDRSPPAPGS